LDGDISGDRKEENIGDTESSPILSVRPVLVDNDEMDLRRKYNKPPPISSSSPIK
jgi:hypothetical protein